MSYKVIVDSCGEFTPEMKADGGFEHVALGIQIEDTQWTDDDSLKQEELLLKIAESTSCAKTSCPSPERYMESYHCDAERIYVVTLSAELSGSYNSAVLGKNLYEEEYGEKQIHVFNSRSASVGETLIALKVQQCEKAGMTFEEVVESVECYIEEQHTYFVLENLDTLRKNGRLTGIKSLVAGALNIKTIMGSTSQGTICQKEKARGMKKALVKMADCVAADVVNAGDKILAIAHCNCEERAKEVQRLLKERFAVKSSFIVDTSGISTVYANDGGIIVVV